MSINSITNEAIAVNEPSAAAGVASSSRHPIDPRKKQLVGWQHSVAGSLGGMAGAIVTSPFDVVKTRLQSDLFRVKATPPAAAAGNGAAAATAAVLQHEAQMAAKSVPSRGGVVGGLYQFVDTMYLIRRIQVEEGWRALYKGLGPSLGGIIPARAINFYFYPTSKAFLAKAFPNAPTEKEGQTAEDSPLVHLGAAVIAGVCTSTGTNPIWVVKTRLQLSARKRDAGVNGVPRSAYGMTMHILKNEGFKGLYRGLSASYLGVSEGVIQWTLYERFKRIGRTRSVDLNDEKTPLMSKITSILGASGGAKAIASLITYPHEVIRTRLRQPAVDGVQKYTGLMQTLKLVLKEEGVASLYGGLTAHMFRVVPNAACMFLIYELVAAKLGS